MHDSKLMSGRENCTASHSWLRLSALLQTCWDWGIYSHTVGPSFSWCWKMFWLNKMFVEKQAIVPSTQLCSEQLLRRETKVPTITPVIVKRWTVLQTPPGLFEGTPLRPLAVAFLWVELQDFPTLRQGSGLQSPVMNCEYLSRPDLPSVPVALLPLGAVVVVSSGQTAFA